MAVSYIYYDALKGIYCYDLYEVYQTDEPTEVPSLHCHALELAESALKEATNGSESA